MAPSTLTSPAQRGSAATGRSSDFAELMRQVRAAGLLERRPGNYPLWRSYAQAIRHLHDVGRPPPATTAA